jgi:thiol-disulfide isomerase/thioredoxin
MNKKIVALFLLAVAIFFGENPNPPNSNDEIFLYRPVEAVAKGHFPLNQGAYGTCVAFGHAAACDILAAIDYIAGRTSKWLPASPDAIYAGSRNEAYQRESRSYSQGSSGRGAVQWLNKYGGVLYKQPYPEFDIDLSQYSIPRSRDWGAYGNGGRSDGINGKFDEEAAKHPIKKVALVRTLEELDVALKNGWPVTICSGQGFTSTRDSDGFCAPRGSWSHCMLICGKRGEGRKGYLILNSWGNDWVSGPKYKDQPDGSFYAEPAVVLRILRAGDSWALSDAEGFKPRILPDWMLDPNGKAPIKLASVESETDRDSHSYGSALAEHEKDGKPLVVFIHADWCGPCREMELKSFPHVKNFNLVAFGELKLDDPSDDADGYTNEYISDIMEGNSVPQLIVHRKVNGVYTKKVYAGFKTAAQIEAIFHDANIQPVSQVDSGCRGCR